MIFDAISFRQTLSETNLKSRAFGAFSDYLEKRLGAKVVYDLRNVPFGRADLIEPLQLAEFLKKRGVIKEYGPMNRYPDVPHAKGWIAICNNETNHRVGGMTWESDGDALRAALSEGLERYIWMTQTDYFVNPIKATTADMKKHGLYIAPEDVAGFSEEQRAHYPAARILRPDAEYLWIQGTSLIHGKKVYAPAQVVSGFRRENPDGTREPYIRQPITNGLATWPTRSGARMAGALEVLEREAYMIMWLNQLTLPRIAISSLTAQSPSFAKAIAMSERYRFKTHVIPLPTDAPTNAVMVVMEDLSGSLPRFTVGLKAHRSLAIAAEKAMTEALRSHHWYRVWTFTGNTWDTKTPTQQIGHRDRLYYWSVPENAKYLEFMLRGPEVEAPANAWENDTIEEHLQRIVGWCKEMSFDCVSFDLGRSAKNPTPLFIEMVVIPQLQPTYLAESIQHFGGTRWHEVPKKLGYAPRKTPYAERPHPFS